MIKETRICTTCGGQHDTKFKQCACCRESAREYQATRRQSLMQRIEDICFNNKSNNACREILGIIASKRTAKG